MSFDYFDWIAHHAEVRGDHTALIDLASERRFTYRQLDDRIDRLAAHFRALGANKGDRIAVLAQNTTETLEVQFAVARIGAIFVPLNVRLTVHELEFIVGDAEIALLQHDPDLEPMALDLQRRCGFASVRWPMAGRSRRPSRPRRGWSGMRRWRSMRSRPSCTPPAPRAGRRVR